MKGLKVVFWAYRDWAVSVYPAVKKHPKVWESVFCRSRDEVMALNLKEYQLLLTCGLSEELGHEITDSIEAIGVHCAELDRYSYGTPIQLQVLDGITMTRHRIFSFTSQENSSRAHTHNRLYANEVPLDLSGNMDDILEQMTATSKVLFNQFLNDYPNHIWRTWEEEEIVRKKRTPKDSRLTKEDFGRMDTEQLYNFFRCLEAPYPNGYVEDEKGRLYIERVSYKRNIPTL